MFRCIQFTMRDLFWMAVVVGILTAWYIDSGSDMTRTIFPRWLRPTFEEMHEGEVMGSTP